MLDKLSKAFGFLKDEVTALTDRVATLETLRPIVKNGQRGEKGEQGEPGKDGISPDVDALVEDVLAKIPEPEKVDTDGIIEKVLAQIPKPRDGRDAPVVNASDVAAIVMSKIAKPKDGKDGKDGRDGPTLSAVVEEVTAQIEPGPQGPQGPRGPKGEDGVSVTDVRLTNNELFVFLDGQRRRAGKIDVPTFESFTPGVDSIGGGGRRTIRVGETINNRVVINSSHDWPDEVAGEIPLEPNKEYYIGDARVTIPNKFRLTGPVAITGGPGVSGLSYSGADPLFNGVDFGRLVLTDLLLDSPNANVFNLEDSAVPTASIVNIRGMDVARAIGVGTIKDILGITFDLANFRELTQGLQDIGTTTAVLSVQRITAFSTNAAFKFFDLGNNVYDTVEFSNMRTVAPAGAFGISGLANSGNLLPGQVATVTSCEFLGGVTPLENIARQDVRWDFQGNSGIGDSLNEVDAYLTGGTETIAISGIGQFEEIGVPSAGGVTWASDIMSRFTVGSDGVITYIGEKPLCVQLEGIATVEKVGGGSDEIEVRFAKNWVPNDTGIEKSRAITQNNTPTSVTIAALIELVQGDNIRAIFRNNGSVSDILAQVTSLIVKE